MYARPRAIRARGPERAHRARRGTFLACRPQDQEEGAPPRNGEARREAGPSLASTPTSATPAHLLNPPVRSRTHGPPAAASYQKESRRNRTDLANFSALALVNDPQGPMHRVPARSWPPDLAPVPNRRAAGCTATARRFRAGRGVARICGAIVEPRAAVQRSLPSASDDDGRHQSPDCGAPAAGAGLLRLHHQVHPATPKRYARAPRDGGPAPPTPAAVAFPATTDDGRGPPRRAAVPSAMLHR